jgi:enolase
MRGYNTLDDEIGNSICSRNNMPDMSYLIESVTAQEILDNRLEPTLRVTVKTGKFSGTADVPAGRSTGENEAVDLRDEESRYDGLGVQSAISNIEKQIEPELVGEDVRDQRQIDMRMIDLDGTEKKEIIGGNAITGVSLAAIKTGARASGLPVYRYIAGSNSHVLPVPFFNLIEGGELADSQLTFQEHQVVPLGAESFSGAIRKSAEVYYELEDVINDEFPRGSLNVGYEGGYNPVGAEGPREAFDLLIQAIENCGYDNEFVLAADVAASHFYDRQSDVYHTHKGEMQRDELISFYEELIASYPIISLEDPLDQQDFEGWSELIDRTDIQIVGDDLFVTNPDRVRRGIKENAANSLLVKINQVGTVTEAMEASELAVENGYSLQVSERSGQTSDTWLADFTVGVGAGQIKTGVTRSERTEQYNRLIEIENNMGPSCDYGADTLSKYK